MTSFKHVSNIFLTTDQAKSDSYWDDAPLTLIISNILK